jgi:hypothetical protein
MEWRISCHQTQDGLTWKIVSNSHVQHLLIFFLVSKELNTTWVQTLTLVQNFKSLQITLVFLHLLKTVSHIQLWMHIFAIEALLVFFYLKVKIQIQKIDQCNQFIYLLMEQKWQTSLTVWWIILGMVSTQVKSVFLDSQVSLMEIKEFIILLTQVLLLRNRDSHLFHNMMEAWQSELLTQVLFPET